MNYWYTLVVKGTTIDDLGDGGANHEKKLKAFLQEKN